MKLSTSSTNAMYRHQLFNRLLAVTIILIHPSVIATSTPCGSTLTGRSGAFSSPNFPQNYDNSLQCDWTITISVPVSSIELTFETFNLEFERNCEYDYVEVWKGSPEEEHLLGRFCGDKVTQGKFPPSQGSLPYRQITVRFRTDAWVTSRGFNATYISNDLGVVNCGQFDFSCTDGSGCVPLTRSCDGRNDCWDGSDESGCECQSIPNTYSFCKGNINYGEMSSRKLLGPNVQLVLLQNIIQNIEGLRGTCHPEITAYLCALLAPKCENNRTQPVCYSWCKEVQESVVLPSCFLRDYFLQQQFPPCDTFPHENCFNVEEREGCFYGKGQNYRGTKSVTESGYQCIEWQTSTPFDTSIGDAIGPYNLEKNHCRNPYSFDRPWCYVLGDSLFNSDSEYCDISVCDGNRLFNCGNNYTDGSGWFASPGFPQAYDIAMQCKWTITVAQTFAVEIAFSEFELQAGTDSGCLYDKVELFDGDWPDGSFESIGVFCGNESQPTVRTTSYILTVRMSTDYVTNSRGFNASYTSVARDIVTCTEGSWLCSDRAKCVLLNRLCDGKIDCWDRSDEQNCECQLIPEEASGFCPPTGAMRWPTVFPNLYNHQNVTEVLRSRERNIVLDSSTLTGYPCHLQGWYYTCYNFFPGCMDGLRVPPCRSWCLEILNGCQDEYSSSFTELVSCDDLPFENCWDGNAATECYFGSGENYRGTVSSTVSGKPCIEWEGRTYELIKHPWANLEDNYCRNPDGAERPWCYVGKDGQWEYCDIEPCSGLVCKDRGMPRRVRSSLTRENYWPGEKMTYSCEPGFNLVGAAISECQRDASWDTPVPTCTADERARLLTEKFIESQYSSDLPPNGEGLVITVEGLVSSIVNVDETIPSIITDSGFYLRWSDPRLSWTPSSYGELERVEIGMDRVWRPSIQLLRSASPDFQGFPEVNLVIRENGEVLWVLETLVVTTCDLQQYFFPFDNMTCPICVRGKFRSGDEIRCRNSTKGSRVLNCESVREVPGGEWRVSVTLEANGNKACLNLHLWRNPTYHMCTTVTPFIVLSLLMCITFFIPLDSGDRLGYGMTILLSMFVNLVVITGFLPRSGDIPFIGIVNIVVIVMMSVFMLITAWVVRVSRRETEMSQCTKVFFLGGCARMVLLGDLRRSSKEDSMNGVILVKNRIGPDPDDNVVTQDNNGAPGSSETAVATLLRSIKQSLEALRESLDGWKKDGACEDDEAGQSDWVRLAHVLDRLCFIFYLGGLVASVPIILQFGRREQP